MTDHELCLLAAKAAGYTVEDRRTCILLTLDSGLSGRWDPINYGSTAFRLMVDCGIDVRIRENNVRAANPYHADFIERFEPYGNDKHAATRRAIVRAAATMGE